MTNPLLINKPETWYYTELPLSKTKIHVKPYGLKACKALSILHAESELKKDQRIVIAGLIGVIQDSIKENISVIDLDLADFVFLSNKMRSAIKGDDLKYKVRCDNEEFKDENNNIIECGNVNMVTFDIENYTIKNTNTSSEVVVSIGNEKEEIKYGIFMKKITAGLLLEKPYIIENIESIEKSIRILAELIDFVTIIKKDEEIKIDQLTDDEKEEFLLELTTDQATPLLEWFKNTPKLILKKKFICTKCKKEQEIEIEDVKAFFD